MSVSQEIVASNQVQFSLAIPLAKYNMCTHFRKPQAITIERSVAASAVFSLPMPTANFKFRGCGESGIEGGSSGVPLTSLSQDRMTAIVQVVKRDLRNRRCQATGAHQDSYNASANKIQISEMSRRSRLPKKVKICAPTKGHQSSKMNKGSIFLQDAANQKAAVITRTHSLSNACFSEGGDIKSDKTNSPPTRDTPSFTKVTDAPASDIDRLQLDMELCLQQIESVQRRALSEHNIDFLRPCVAKNNYSTSHIDGTDERNKCFINEQRHHTLRTVYALQQQLRDLENSVIGLPSKSLTQKSLAAHRLAAVNRGAVKLLQTFVGQLPLHDLKHGLPAHFRAVAELVRRVTLISAGVTSSLTGDACGRLSPVQSGLIAKVDEVEALNKVWQDELNTRRATADVHCQSKPPFVTDVGCSDSSLPREKFIVPNCSVSKLHQERRAILQSGVGDLLEAYRGEHCRQGTVFNKPHRCLRRDELSQHAVKHCPKVRRGHGRVPPAKKGYLLSNKACDHRGRASTHYSDRAAVLHFSDSTVASEMKTVPSAGHSELGTRSGWDPPIPEHRMRVTVPSECQHLSTNLGVHRTHFALRSDITASASCPHCNCSCKQEVSCPTLTAAATGSHDNVPLETFRNSESRPVPHSKPAESSFSGDCWSDRLLREVRRRVKVKLIPHSPASDGSAIDPYNSLANRFDRVVDKAIDNTLSELADNCSSLQHDDAAFHVASDISARPALESILQKIEQFERENEMMQLRYSSSVVLRDSLVRDHHRKPLVKGCWSCVAGVPEPLHIVKPKRDMYCDGPRHQALPGRNHEGGKVSTAVSGLYPGNDLGLPTGTTNYPSSGSRPINGIGLPVWVGAEVPKRRLYMEHYMVERITDSVERFEVYWCGLKHNLGKSDPIAVLESIANNILLSSCQDVAVELESFNADLAEHIYTSEFIDEGGDTSVSQVTPDETRVSDFSGKNPAVHSQIRDDVVSKSIQSNLPLDQHDVLSISSYNSHSCSNNKSDIEDDSSPIWDCSVDNVFYGTALYTAETVAVGTASSKASVSGMCDMENEGGTCADVDTNKSDNSEYEDDYTSVSCDSLKKSDDHGDSCTNSHSDVDEEDNNDGSHRDCHSGSHSDGDEEDSNDGSHRDCHSGSHSDGDEEDSNADSHRDCHSGSHSDDKH